MELWTNKNGNTMGILQWYYWDYMAIIWESNGVIMEKPTIFFGFNGSIFGGLISNPIHKPLGRLIGRYHLSRHFGAPIINQPGIFHPRLTVEAFKHFILQTWKDLSLRKWYHWSHGICKWFSCWESGKKPSSLAWLKKRGEKNYNYHNVMWREPSIKMRKHLQGCKIEHPQVALSMLELDVGSNLSARWWNVWSPSCWWSPYRRYPKVHMEKWSVIYQCSVKKTKKTSCISVCWLLATGICLGTEFQAHSWW